jgi:hypothetical protein
MNLKEILENNQVLLVVLPNNDYSENLVKCLKCCKEKKIGYVTTNKGYWALNNYFEKEKINTNSMFFIDCVSKTIGTPKIAKNCTFISSPNALTELSIACKGLIKLNVPLIVIDSLSTLAIYKKSSTLIKFVHDLTNKARESSTKLVWLISDKDRKTPLFQNLGMIVDNTVEMYKIKE